MTVVIINPGTGPVAGASPACARENVDAFVAELALSPPAVTVTVREQNEGDGRFEFLLRRGICETEVSMPGLSLSRVRYVRGESAWSFPRLYVDGNSWLWEFAIEIARDALRDHDGAIERHREESRQRAMALTAATPRCPSCQTVFVIRETDEGCSVVCLACNPSITESRQDLLGATYVDDGWQSRRHYLVRTREMPPEVPGHDDPLHPDALCGAPLFNDCCQRARAHAGRCEGRWRVLERRLVEPKEG